VVRRRVRRSVRWWWEVGPTIGITRIDSRECREHRTELSNGDEPEPIGGWSGETVFGTCSGSLPGSVVREPDRFRTDKSGPGPRAVAIGRNMRRTVCRSWSEKRSSRVADYACDCADVIHSPARSSEISAASATVSPSACARCSTDWMPYWRSRSAYVEPRPSIDSSS
jgi:hypothetical protein